MIGSSATDRTPLAAATTALTALIAAIRRRGADVEVREVIGPERELHRDVRLADDVNPAPVEQLPIGFLSGSEEAPE